MVASSMVASSTVTTRPKHHEVADRSSKVNL